jgi:hypothetical protein
VAIADYDVAVANWFAVQADAADGWPEFAGLGLRKRRALRYGENPHQQAAVYADPVAPPGLAQAEQLHGKEMSYNNYVDADAAWRTVHDFAEPAVAIIKHANPCGVAVGADLADAHRKAHLCDPVSAYGGVIAANGPVTVELAKQIADIFTEVVVAPSYVEGAVEVLAAKKNIRLLRAPAFAPLPAEWRQVSGGVLVQMRDAVDAPGDDPQSWTLACGPALSGVDLADLVFAWRAGALGEVERDPARVRGRDGRRRHGSGEPGRLGPPRGGACRRPGRRVGRGVGRVLPVPRRAWRCWPRAAFGPWRSRRLDARRRGDRGSRGSGADHVLHRHAPLLPLTRPAGVWCAATILQLWRNKYARIAPESRHNCKINVILGHAAWGQRRSGAADGDLGAAEGERDDVGHRLRALFDVAALGQVVHDRDDVALAGPGEADRVHHPVVGAPSGLNAQPGLCPGDCAEPAAHTPHGWVFVAARR